MPTLISADSIITASKFLGKIANGPTFFLVPAKRGITIVATNKGNVGTFRVPCDPFLTESVEIGRDALINAVKNRKDVMIEQTAGALVITSKAYTAELAVAEAASVPMMQKAEGEEAKTVVLEEAVWQWIAESITRLQLERTATTVDVSLYVRVNQKGAFAVAYDMNHMAFVFDKALKGDVEFMLPMDVAQLLVKELPVVGTEIVLTRGAATFQTKTLGVQIALASEAGDNALNPADVYAKCLEVPKAEGTSAQIDRASLESFVENGQALTEAKSSIVSFRLANKGSTAEMKSASGRVKAALKVTCDTEVKFALSFSYVQQLLEKGKGKEAIEITVIPESFALLKNAGCYYVAALVSEAT